MSGQNWSRASLIELVEYIQWHHRQLREKFLRLQSLIEEASGLHGGKQNSIFASLKEFLPIFKNELESHFASEEQVLIPYIRQMDEFEKNKGSRPPFHHSSIKNPISRLEREHDQTENVMFVKLRSLTGDYQPPAGSGAAEGELYAGLKDIEKELSEHIRIENSSLFPLAIELELNLMHKK